MNIFDLKNQYAECININRLIISQVREIIKWDGRGGRKRAYPIWRGMRACPDKAHPCKYEKFGNYSA
jgi:hypothetical protein